MTRRVQAWLGIGILSAIGAALVVTAVRAPASTKPTAHVTRAVAWRDSPGSGSTGWQRERWIMANQPAWIQREWRAASCPPVRVNTEFYYFSAGTGRDNDITLSMPPANAEPLWWDAPIPPTGFPIAGQRGC